jgi:hypothetical protein
METPTIGFHDYHDNSGYRMCYLWIVVIHEFVQLLLLACSRDGVHRSNATTYHISSTLFVFMAHNTRQQQQQHQQ